MALTLYGDPGSRVRSSYGRTPPWQRREEERKQSAPQPVTSSSASRSPGDALFPVVPKPKSENKGLAESFFTNTSLGKGLGVVINNPVVKGLLQPLDLLGVPQRAIASTIQELGDFAAGRGFSPQDWYDQTNPFYAIHGENAQDSIGMGDVWRNFSPLAGKNRWVDAVAGFGLDVATDPLTYAFGAGLVDKGLDALRSGTRLGAAIASKGDEAVDLARKADWQSQRLRPQQGQGTRAASLMGRPIRMQRVSQADDLVRRADADTLARLYGSDARGADFVQEVRQELAYRAGRGLGATTRAADDPVREVVETALNIKPPATTFRPTNSQLAFTQRPAQALANQQGRARFAFNQRRPGASLIDMRTPTDYQQAYKQLAMGERLSPEAFADAAQTIRYAERVRPNKGEFQNLGQRAVRAEQKALAKEMRSTPGGRSKYTSRAELQGGTALNRIFDYAKKMAEDRFGVTIPQFSGDLQYVPHIYTSRFAEDFRRNEAFANRFADLTGTTRLDMLSDTSGRLQSRQLRANMEIELPNGRTINTGSGTIDEINEAAKAAGYGPILETDPIKLVETYIDSVAEDVGRRAARAEMIALGEEGFDYNLADTRRLVDDEGNQLMDELGEPATEGVWNDTRVLEAAKEQASAIERLRRETPTYSPRVEPGLLDTLIEQRDIDAIGRHIADGQLPDFLVERFEEWKAVGANNLVLMDPEVNQRFVSVVEQARSTNVMAQMYRSLNNSFKTFAVLTPGFHVRNWLSATFMNFADGVTAQNTRWGMAKWREFTNASKESIDGGMKWLSRQPPDVQEAFRAVFASGAGGRLAEQGVREGTFSFLDRMQTNSITRKSQDAGSFVEGSVRLGMARDSLLNGGSAQDAAARITRVHFDYGQLSPFDQKAKSIVPFWSFVSRNTPLQIMQEWSRPQTYNRYEMFRRNFADPTAFEEGDEVPDYIKAGRGIPLNLGPFNWFEPDFAHTRVSEDIERLANFANDPTGLLSNVTPVISAPLEYGFRRDAFTGQTFGPDDWAEFDLSLTNPSAALGLVAALPAWAAGGGDNVRINNGKLYIKTEALNALEATQPLLARGTRLSGQGNAEGRQLETLARLFGGPVRNITQEQIDSARVGNYYDALDEYRARQATGG